MRQCKDLGATIVGLGPDLDLPGAKAKAMASSGIIVTKLKITGNGGRFTAELAKVAFESLATGWSVTL